MAFNTTSFFAGVGTVFAAVMIGFAGGALIHTPSPKMEPNRLERVASSTPAVIAAATKAETPAVPSVPTIKAEAPAVPSLLAANATPEIVPSPDRVATTAPAPASPQVIPPQPQPVVARDDVASQFDNAKKVREGELRKQAELKESERRAEQRRRKRQEVAAAVDAVKRMKRDGVLQEAAQQDEAPRLGLGFFGHD
jgi:hypothetical protein